MMGHESLGPAKRRYDAVVFDMDGVVTDTAGVHSAAWKQLFDEYLRSRSEREGLPFEPFDVQRDYARYVDGKPRYDGVRSFLASRGISVPYGTPDDQPELETICGLGNRKNQYFLESLKGLGARAMPSTVQLVRDLKKAGVRVAVISASRNARSVLDAAGVAGLFDAQLDGVDAANRGLPGKPDPAVFLEAARELGAPPSRTAIVEDSLSGVEAGLRGRFGLVVGVDRGNQARALRAAGAHLVVDVANIQAVLGRAFISGSEEGGV